MQLHGTCKNMDIEDFYYTVNYLMYFQGVYKIMKDLKCEFQISYQDLSSGHYKDLLKLIEGESVEEKINNFKSIIQKTDFKIKPETKISYIDFVKQG